MGLGLRIVVSVAVLSYFSGLVSASSGPKSGENATTSGRPPGAGTISWGGWNSDLSVGLEATEEKYEFNIYMQNRGDVSYTMTHRFNLCPAEKEGSGQCFSARIGRSFLNDPTPRCREFSLPKSVDSHSKKRVHGRKIRGFHGCARVPVKSGDGKYLRLDLADLKWSTDSREKPRILPTDLPLVAPEAVPVGKYWLTVYAEASPEMDDFRQRRVVGSVDEQGEFAKPVYCNSGPLSVVVAEGAGYVDRLDGFVFEDPYARPKEIDPGRKTSVSINSKIRRVEPLFYNLKEVRLKPPEKFQVFKAGIDGRPDGQPLADLKFIDRSRVLARDRVYCRIDIVGKEREGRRSFVIRGEGRHILPFYSEVFSIRVMPKALKVWPPSVLGSIVVDTNGIEYISNEVHVGFKSETDTRTIIKVLKRVKGRVVGRFSATSFIIEVPDTKDGRGSKRAARLLRGEPSVWLALCRTDTHRFGSDRRRKDKHTVYWGFPGVRLNSAERISVRSRLRLASDPDNPKPYIAPGESAQLLYEFRNEGKKDVRFCRGHFWTRNRLHLMGGPNIEPALSDTGHKKRNAFNPKKAKAKCNPLVLKSGDVYQVKERLDLSELFKISEPAGYLVGMQYEGRIRILSNGLGVLVLPPHVVSHLRKLGEFDPDECDFAERPEAPHPGLLASEATLSSIEKYKNELRRMGVFVDWDPERRKYMVTGAAQTPDPRLIYPEEQRCKQGDKCVLIPSWCCDCHSEGRQTAIRKDRVEIAKKRRKICHWACPASESNHPSCSAKEAVCSYGWCVPKTW